MKNAKIRRILLLLACAVLLVSLSVGATLAYLTSTDEVENTFTVGSVNIKLDEADVYETGETEDMTKLGTKKSDADRVKENKYKLLPGKTYDKDPMVTVLAGSEESYIRMIVTVSDITKLKAAFPNQYINDDGSFNLAAFVNNTWDASKWVYYTGSNAAGGVYEFRYYETVNTLPTNDAATGSNLALEPLFEEIKIPGEITKEQLANLQGVSINIVAHAIQAEGFAGADEAWAAFDSQEAN